MSQVMEQYGQCFPVVEACYSWTWNDFHMTPHCHDRDEIMYLLRGKARIQLFADGAEREIALSVGDFIYIEAGVIHALQVDEICYMVNVEYSFSTSVAMLTMEMLEKSSAAYRAWLRQKKGYQCGKDPDGALYEALSAVVDDYTKKDDVDHALRELHIAQMMVHMAKTLVSGAGKQKCLVHVRRCVSLLSERMGEEVKIDNLAEEIGVSPSYLQRIFHQVQGVTIVEYLNRLRIDRSKLLLLHTGDSIVDIALASGFNTRQHFCRVFKGLEGCSPQGYRRNMVSNSKKQPATISVIMSE